jgi:hypothetical protein
LLSSDSLVRLVAETKLAFVSKAIAWGMNLSKGTSGAKEAAETIFL